MRSTSCHCDFRGIGQPSHDLISIQVGLAVGDTEKMKKLATIKRLALQIKYHIEIEESYPGFITQAVYEEVYDDKPNKRPLLLR